MLASAAPPGQNRSQPIDVANSLASGLLLAFTGGVLDAFLYLAHGHVFAGAMTGNAVLTGIAVMTRHWRHALHHTLPILAFAAGIWSAFLLESRLRCHAAVAGLSLELAGLFAASWLPMNVPNAVFIVAVSGLAGFQVATFRRIDEFSYNSTFITGAMHRALDALHRMLGRDRAQAWREFRDLGLVLVVFLAGAVAGALVTPRLGNHALWLGCAALLVVLLAELRAVRLRKERAGRPARPGVSLREPVSVDRDYF